ncbi:hypothetical protein [Kurthia sibirica]|uniref:Pilus assembly protein PilO n=1 Tax=Kurthia sibirica TaxID=202750 RepID=A0A2U3AIE4_9BACL|nr:hypothetical protein [Kurthia sibirica]PWI24318.1 hypothetical protein DEX24_13930 [Kurthia sibirica]GEK34396.1 hypothetical protein KSI01_19290 [Kurthia sibirica]
MRAKKAQNKPLIFTLLIILILAVAVALYIYLLKPEMDYRDSLHDKYNFQTEYVEMLEDQLKKEQNDAKKAQPLAEMEAQIPFNNDLQGLLDNIASAESASSTVVTDLHINNYEQQDELVTTSKKVGAITEKELLETQANIVPVSAIAAKHLPKKLQLITFELTVSGYEASEVNSFIKSMLNQKRIYVIDEVQYSAPSTDDGVVTATIQMTSFASQKVKADNKKETAN